MTPTSAPTPPASGGAQPGAARPSSPESLDGIIATTSPRGWWALWAIAGVVVLALVWSIVATIPQQKSATGMVSPYAYSHDITATVAGVFTSQTLSTPTPGASLTKITAGAVLGSIAPFDGSMPVDVLAPVDGSLQSLYVAQGQGVEPGMTLASMYATPDPSSPLALIAWVPMSTAYSVTVGSTADVTVTDVTTGQVITAPATIQAIANTPSSLESMTTISGDPTLAEQWSQEAGGQPYRVDLGLDLSSWPEASSHPAPGSVISIVATYAEVHPIEMLFGGAS